MVRIKINSRVELWQPGADLTAATLGAEVNDIAETDLPSRIFVDLRHVLRADVDGLVWLVNLKLACREQGGRLVLLAPSPAVQSMLKEARVQGRFEQAASLEAVRDMMAADENGKGRVRVTSGS